MRYFDLHCDTLTECAVQHVPLSQNQLHVDLDRAGLFETYVQCCAAWLSDDTRGEPAVRRFKEIAGLLEEEAAANPRKLTLCREGRDLDRLRREGGCGAILTVENAAALGGDINNIQEWKDRGVAMCTLTWNGENELGRGVLAPGEGGLTPFGRRAVRELEQAGILLDVSHASPELFWEVAELASTPLVASHSNSKSLCGHPRNLTDEQFAAIRDSGGLVGLNFYKAFLNDRPEEARMADILRHARHFLELGGEDVLAMGSDFDGAALPADMEDGLASVFRLRELFLQENYPEALVEKLFYGNAARFFAGRFGALSKKSEELF